MNKRNDYETISGAEKAALLLLTLGEDYTSKIFQMMEESEIIEISQRMVSLGNVNAALIEKLFLEFVEGISSRGTVIGSLDSTERLLRKTMSKEQAARVIEELSGPAGRTMWDKISNINEEVMANYLRNEYPQTAAVILSKIKTEQSARILAHFPNDFAMEVIMRTLRLDAVPREVLSEVERTLRGEFMNNINRSNVRDPHEILADMFSYLDRTVEDTFMNSLAELNPEAAERIKALMFKFEDLIKLDATGMQVLIRVVDKSSLALALKGASDSLKLLFYANMSERAAKLLKEEIVALGMVKLRDVDAAQLAIVNQAKELAEQGQLMLADRKGEEDQMVS